MAGNNIMGSARTMQAVSAPTPFSFKAALDQIEDEIEALATEVGFCKKETKILKDE